MHIPMLTLLLALITTAVAADPFLELEQAHNAGNQIPMTTRVVHRWNDMFSDGRGTAKFSDIQWSNTDPVGIARWNWTRGKEYQTGWLVLMLNESGQIDNFYYTQKPRPQVNNALAGQSADSATTVYGLAAGATEANPLLAGAAGPAIAAIKIGTTLAVQEYASVEHCIGFSRAAGPVGWGAAAWNVGILAGAGPIAAVPAVVIAAASYIGDEPLWRCLPDDIADGVHVQSASRAE